MISFTRKKYLEVWRGDRYISQHTSVLEAGESASKDAKTAGDGTYDVKVGSEIWYTILIDGIDEMATTVGTGGNVEGKGLTPTPTPNAPPTIVGTPAPTFGFGSASEYDLDQHMTDTDGDPLTCTVSGALPSGVTLRNNSNDNALVYDGIGAVTTSASHTMTADDGVDTSSPSSAFSIIISDADFTSDNVMWADQETVTLGTVPSVYAGYQMLQTVASHFNMFDNATMTLSAGTHELIYAHPTLNSHTTDRPDFLSTWTYTGNTGSITAPGRDGTGETVTTYYYKKDVSGTFNWNWRTSNVEDQLNFFVGAFLIPSGVTVSAVVPELYKVLPNISNTYVAPDTNWFWEEAPSSLGTATETATSWANLETRVNAASPGDIIKLTPGTYNDDGEISITKAGDETDPIFIDLSGSTLRGSTGLEFNDTARGIRCWGGKDDEGTGNRSMQRFQFRVGSRWCSVEDFFNDGTSQDFDNDPQPGEGPWDNKFSLAYVRGQYNRVTNCAARDKVSSGTQLLFVQSVGDVDGYRFCLAQYNHFKDFNTGDLIGNTQNNAFFHYGGSSYYYTNNYTIMRRNKTENWNKTPGDGEWFVCKSSGGIVCENVHISGNSSDGCWHTRVGAWNVVMGNYHDNDLAGASSDLFSAQGVPYTADAEYLDSRHITCRNYLDNWQSGNTAIQVNSIAITSSNRYVCDGALIAEIYVPNATDQVIRYNGDSTAFPDNIYIKALAVDSTTTLINGVWDPHAGSPDKVNYEGCYFDGTSLGITNPGGISESSPGFSARGDGLLVTNTAVNALAKDLCIPCQLVGPNTYSAKIGTTYVSFPY